MKLCTDYWHVQTTQMKTHLETAPGDALLAAAAVIYLGVFEQDTRQKLQNLWQDLCTSGVNVDMGKRSKIVKIPINPNFAITAILSSEEEQMEWKKKGLPRDQQAVVNGLIMRTCCFVAQKCWPILIDPHDEADHWVRAIEDVMTRIETGKGMNPLFCTINIVDVQ